MRILLIAPTASTRFGGEAILPVHWFRTLRKAGVDVQLLTHARARDELIELFADDRERLHFVEDTWVHRGLDAPSRWLPRRLHEVSFAMALELATQFDLRRAASQIIREQQIELVHVPTPVSPKAPSVLRFDVPTIFGPMNGGMSFPPAFRHRDSILTRAIVQLGRTASAVANRLFSGKRSAALLLVANQRTRESLPAALRCVPCRTMVENGVDLAAWCGPVDDEVDSREETSASTSDGSALRLVTIGRLVDCKAVDQLLQAISKLPARLSVSLDVIGDGPERSSLEAMARQLGLDAQVKFHGHLSQAECRAHLEAADVFILPSLHECGGAVVLEAMAVGIPIIAADWGGPADYLDGDSGILIPADHQYSDRLAAAITELTSDDTRRARLAKYAQHRVRQHFDWDAKGREMIQIYHELHSAHRADQGQPIG